MANRYGKMCQNCYTTFQHLNQLTKDHIVPRWQGGSNDIDNLQLLCLPCHIEKNRLFDSRSMSPVPFMFDRYIEVMNGYRNGQILDKLLDRSIG